MSNEHISDQDLLLAADGELSARDARRVEEHLVACWTCRARRQELETAIGDFVRLHQQTPLPSADGPLALLKAQIANLENARIPSHRFVNWSLATAVFTLMIFGLIAWRFHLEPEARVYAMAVPNPELTPGATVLVGQGEICREAETKNKSVPIALQKKVLETYGIANSKPQAYEIDYLITPALGGADDIHNLWPQAYATTIWNAGVKDQLEDYLRNQVCAGRLDLSTAQREIAGNWVDAYKKYFHTETPLR